MGLVHGDWCMDKSGCFKVTLAGTHFRLFSVSPFSLHCSYPFYGGDNDRYRLIDLILCRKPAKTDADSAVRLLPRKPDSQQHMRRLRRTARACRSGAERKLRHIGDKRLRVDSMKRQIAVAG